MIVKKSLFLKKIETAKFISSSDNFVNNKAHSKQTLINYGLHHSVSLNLLGLLAVVK